MPGPKPQRRKRVIDAGSMTWCDGQREPLHIHPDRGQLKWPATGIASVRTPEGIFVAAPSHAVWIPPGRPHGGMYSGEVCEQSLYVAEAHCAALPARCCLVAVGPRLVRTIAGLRDDDGGYGRRTRKKDLAIVDLLSRDVVDTGRRALDLPIPESPDLLPIVNALLLAPSDARSNEQWAALLGISTRSLTRAFTRATGKSFGEWRKRARVHAALQRLSAGLDVATVARELGYRSTSAFVFMFRSTSGVTPMRYYRG
jgi:AraC-like DNA-binding protein